MSPSILILESRRDVADALHDVITSANYRAVVVPHVDRLADLETRPAAIVTCITSVGIGEPAYIAIERIRENRPPVVAIARADHEVAEAARLNCEVVLRAPMDLARLCHALTEIVYARPASGA
jgi:CheY-like chemotaxis protein